MSEPENDYMVGLLRKMDPAAPDPLLQAIMDLASAIRGLTYELREKRMEDDKPKPAKWSNKGE